MKGMEVVSMAEQPMISAPASSALEMMRLDGHVHAQVDYLEPAGGEQGRDDVLADVVDVRLDGGQHHHALPAYAGAIFCAQAFQFGSDDRHGGLQGARAEHQLRQEDLAGLELLPDDVRPAHQPVIQDDLRVQPGCQRLARGGFRGFRVAADQ